jgi:hypothetical protein
MAWTLAFSQVVPTAFALQEGLSGKNLVQPTAGSSNIGWAVLREQLTSGTVFTDKELSTPRPPSVVTLDYLLDEENKGKNFLIVTEQLGYLDQYAKKYGVTLAQARERAGRKLVIYLEGVASQAEADALITSTSNLIQSAVEEHYKDKNALPRLNEIVYFTWGDAQHVSAQLAELSSPTTTIENGSTQQLGTKPKARKAVPGSAREALVDIFHYTYPPIPPNNVGDVINLNMLSFIRRLNPTTKKPYSDTTLRRELNILKAVGLLDAKGRASHIFKKISTDELFEQFLEQLDLQAPQLQQGSLSNKELIAARTVVARASLDNLRKKEPPTSPPRELGAGERLTIYGIFSEFHGGYINWSPAGVFNVLLQQGPSTVDEIVKTLGQPSTQTVRRDLWALRRMGRRLKTPLIEHRQGKETLTSLAESLGPEIYAILEPHPKRPSGAEVDAIAEKIATTLPAFSKVDAIRAPETAQPDAPIGSEGGSETKHLVTPAFVEAVLATWLIRPTPEILAILQGAHDDPMLTIGDLMKKESMHPSVAQSIVQGVTTPGFIVDGPGSSLVEHIVQSLVDTDDWETARPQLAAAITRVLEARGTPQFLNERDAANGLVSKLAGEEKSIDQFMDAIEGTILDPAADETFSPDEPPTPPPDTTTSVGSPSDNTDARSTATPTAVWIGPMPKSLQGLKVAARVTLSPGADPRVAGAAATALDPGKEPQHPIFKRQDVQLSADLTQLTILQSDAPISGQTEAFLASVAKVRDQL